MNGDARYDVWLAQSPEHIAAAQKLRARCFGTNGADKDRFDERCLHMLLYDTQSNQLVCCFRLFLMKTGAELEQGYSAQFYDLARLVSFKGAIAELGRFCVDPSHRNPDVLRVAWGALARFVDDHDVKILIGCSSFAGVETDLYRETFALLKARYLAPEQWSPRVRARDIYEFAKASLPELDETRALAQMPPLLRTYLTMGGWVSDHAVVDREMNTLHVFTGLEIRAIPPGRKRLLRCLAVRPRTVGR